MDTPTPVVIPKKTITFIDTNKLTENLTHENRTEKLNNTDIEDALSSFTNYRITS